MKFIKNYSEDRKLMKVKVLYDGGKSWTLQWDGGFYVFQGSVEDFGNFLKKIHVKDDDQLPHSFRSKTYKNIASGLTNGGKTTLWVWEKDLKKLKK